MTNGIGPALKNAFQRRGLPAFRKDLLKSGDRVLFVGDWIATGGQATTARTLVEDAGAHWLGAAVIVDALESSDRRRDLNRRSLLHVREL